MCVLRHRMHATLFAFRKYHINHFKERKKYRQKQQQQQQRRNRKKRSILFIFQLIFDGWILLSQVSFHLIMHVWWIKKVARAMLLLSFYCQQQNHDL